MQVRLPEPTQLPPEQTSVVVQAFPSLHVTLLLVNTQPWLGTQESSVQRLPSLQVRLPEPTHAPPLQTSVVVQRLPSLQGAVLFEYWQPTAGSQVSVVQTSPSLQLFAAPA